MPSSYEIPRSKHALRLLVKGCIAHQLWLCFGGGGGGIGDLLTAFYKANFFSLHCNVILINHDRYFGRRGGNRPRESATRPLDHGYRFSFNSVQR